MISKNAGNSNKTYAEFIAKLKNKKLRGPALLNASRGEIALVRNCCVNLVRDRFPEIDKKI